MSDPVNDEAERPIIGVKREWIIHEDGSRAYIVRKAREGDAQAEDVGASPTEPIDFSIIPELPPNVRELQSANFDEVAEPDPSQAFEAGLKALRAQPRHQTTREALMFEEEHLRFIVQTSPVRDKLNDWDASMILANETRLESTSKFL